MLDIGEDATAISNLSRGDMLTCLVNKTFACDEESRGKILEQYADEGSRFDEDVDPELVAIVDGLS